MDFKKETDLIKRGVEEIIPEESLLKKLQKSEKSGKPLRVKYGIDPTGSDVHIGHLVPIRKMRQFQDLGHTAVVIIGDFTARIGDPTGRDSTRPPLTAEQVKKNAENYMEQIYTVLDRNKTEVRWQSEWFDPMTMSDVIKLLGKFTLAQFLAHDTFRSRYEKGLSLGMHELMYPVLQSYDSVAIEADIELGATEQKFNILAGRDMQRYHGMEEQVAVLMPILTGTDGINKMGKSLNNYIAVNDSPKDKYGRIMSIPDSLIVDYFRYATTVPAEEISRIEAELKHGNTNPKTIKEQLAREIVRIFHGESVSTATGAEFSRVFSQKNIPTDIPEFCFPYEEIWIVKLLTETQLTSSSGEARRMIKQGAVSVDNVKIVDVDTQIALDKELVVKVGKRKFARIKRS